MKKLTILIAACLALVACGKEAPSGGDSAAIADSELTGNTGQVLEVIQVSGYTYIEVRNNGRNLWLASNPVEVAEGEVISWTNSAMMRNFQSKALDKTFEELLFVSTINKGKGSAPQQAASNNSGVVLSTQTAAGYTYIELEKDAGQVVWLAAPETAVSAGSRVSWQGGSAMTNFTSNSLGRTFPEILFVQNLSVAN